MSVRIPQVIVPNEPSLSYCSCVLQLGLLPCCPRRTNDVGVEKVSRDICSCPFLANTISYSVTGDSVDSDSESEPKGGGVRGAFGLGYGGRQLWLKHCTLISWNDFSMALLNKGGFAPQPVCCGLCVLHRGCSCLNALLQRGKKWNPLHRDQSYGALNFLPSPLPLSFLLLWKIQKPLRNWKQNYHPQL